MSERAATPPPVPPDLPPDLSGLWSRIKDVFRQWTGMNLPEAVRSRALELLDRLATQASCAPDDYLQRLDSDRSDRQLFMDHLGLGTTWFMRDAEGLNALVATLGRHNPARRVLHLWSVGCSTGEEPYSLAMALAGAGLRARILATDLNRAALDKADAGRYPAASMERIPEDWRQRYFRAADNGEFRISDRIRQMVQFRLHNLQDNQPPPGMWPKFDAVICRNVLIYFDKNPALAIIERLESFCAPDGFLLLGAIERPLFWLTRRYDPSGQSPAVASMAGAPSGQIVAGELVQIPTRPRASTARPDTARPEPGRRATSSSGIAREGIAREDIAREDSDRYSASPASTSSRSMRRDGPITRLGVQRLLEKAELAEEEQRYDDALELVAQARQKAPLEPSIHLLQGHILMTRGDLGAAIECFRVARFLGRDGWLAPYLLARCLDHDRSSENRDIHEAIEAYRYALGVLESGAPSGYFRKDPDVEGMAGITAESCSRRLRELER